MKKGISIVFATIILISGMHLSIAEHFCGGNKVAVKWSFYGEKAGCGMEKNQNTCPVSNGISSNCCKNEIAYFSVDSNYNLAVFQINDITKKIVQVFTAPVNLFPYSYIASLSSFAKVSPPDKPWANAVSLAYICVFRI